MFQVPVWGLDIPGSRSSSYLIPCWSFHIPGWREDGGSRLEGSTEVEGSLEVRLQVGSSSLEVP